MQIVNTKTSAHRIRRLDSRSKTRIFVWPQGENIMDNLENRRQRPAKLWKPFAVAAAAAAGIKFESIGWSQKAGCSCGCSPGFVVKGQHRPGFDIHVDIAELGEGVVSLAEARMKKAIDDEECAEQA